MGSSDWGRAGVYQGGNECGRRYMWPTDIIEHLLKRFLKYIWCSYEEEVQYAEVPHAVQYSGREQAVFVAKIFGGKQYLGNKFSQGCSIRKYFHTKKSSYGAKYS